MRALVFVLALVLCGCSSTQTSSAPQETKQDSKEEVKTYPMHGVIQSVDPKEHTAKINAGPIGDWMGAMTMDYPIKDQQEFNNLKEGETIDGRVSVQGTSFWVDQIHEAPATPATPAPSK